MGEYLANIHKGNSLPIMAKVCPECPWRKIDSSNQHYPAAREGIFALAEQGIPMSCHMSQRTLSAENVQQGLHQCRGIEHFRANIGVPSQLEPDHKLVHSTREDALKYWPWFYHNWEEVRLKFFRSVP